MLEECQDLPTCEIILSEAVKSVGLLGEIPHSDKDVDLLANFVCQKITPSISRGTAYLKTTTPTCFVYFLVGMGRFYDKQVGYWPIVEEKVGKLDINWRAKWGKIFIQYLEDNDLPKFSEEEGLAYVTPILGHTCIPDCCIDEYFEQVVVPLINHDLLNPLDREEILHDLKVRRKNNASRLELEKKTKQYDERIKTLQQEKKALRNRLEKYDDVASLLAEEEMCETRKSMLHGLENVELSRSLLSNRVDETSDHIQMLKANGKKLWREITVFKNQYQPILNVKPQIDDIVGNLVKHNEEFTEAVENEEQLLDDVIVEWAKLSSEPWNISIGDEILQLPLEQLLDQIEKYQYLKEKQKTILEKIESLEASQKKANKTPVLIFSLLMLIRKTLILMGRRYPVPQPSYLQKLQATYREVGSELHLQREESKRLFTGLPIEERLLESPTSDLHHKLSSLQHMYISLVETREKRTELEKEESQIAGQVRDLISSLDVAVDGDLKARVNRLNDVLKEAQHSQVAALKAQRILETEIRPDLERARSEYRSLQVDLEKLDQQLAELGGGSTQQGLSLVQEYHQSQAAVTQTRQNLSTRYSDFMVIESELQSQGWDTIKRGLEEAVSEIENRIQAARSELEHVERGYDSHPVHYFSVDEPIRRFLLYGGITAENFLIDSVMLFARAKSGERAEDFSDLLLPDRIIQHFQRWWDDYRLRVKLYSALEEETNQTTGVRFRAPQISFNAVTSELIAMVPVQRFVRPEQGLTVRLNVLIADLSTSIYSGQLNLYNRSKGLVETHSCGDIVLSIPSKKYVFHLISMENLIHEWEIPVPGDAASFLAFSAKSHTLIKGEHLPRSLIIIVVIARLRIHPQDCILTEGGSLYGGWKEYVWYEVDLSTVEEFYLIDSAGQSITIPLTSEFGSGISLIGGNQLPGVSSDGRPVFNLPPEFIRVPINDRDELNLLRISLFCADENRSRKSKHYQFDELISLPNKQGDGWIDLPLTADQFLGTDPVGCFTLRVYKPPYLDWQLSFCIVPRLNASYDQEIYLPFREKIPDVIATLTLPEKSKDEFKTEWQTWNYAIRGKTVDGRELRVAVSFDEEDYLLMITVMEL